MKRNLLCLALTLIAAALLAPASWAQTATVKGAVKGTDGKPMPGVQVQFINLDNGRKLNLKTDKKGEYYSLGLASGTYDINFFDPSGQKIFSLNKVRVTLSDENTFDLDLQKEAARAQATQAQQMTPEQKKAIEEAQKENAKIKGLNEKLAAAQQAQDAGNFDQAVQTLSEATQLDPTRDLLWFKLADAQRLWAAKTTSDPAAQKQHYADAIQNYLKAIAIKPQGAYYNNLGEAYAKSGDTPKAVEAYNQAAQLDPTDAGRYYFNEGAVLTNTGKVDDAIAAFDKAIQADPTKADAYYWKGVNLMGKATLKGDKMEAPQGTSEAFNKYLELAPTGPYADPAKQMLASLGEKVETTYGKTKAKKK
jgi:tetratricopeptide (TPR) repeat protein